MRRGLTRAMALLVFGALAAPVAAQEHGLAGVPRDLAASRDHAAIFAYLAAHGLSVFMPTYQYQEVPEARSLGFETDFLPPCDPDAPQFVALRDSGLRLLVPGLLLYAEGSAGGVDPLAELIRCTGRAAIFGVLSQDEPVLNAIPEAEVAALYRRVKAVDPSIPVVMVHAPLLADRPDHARADGRAAYLDAVRRYSQHADWVGFDVYPVPLPISQILTPDGPPPTDPAAAVRAYADWLAKVLPERRHVSVLQGFGIRDLHDPDWAARNVPQELWQAAGPPSGEETRAMYAAARDAGHGLIVWWGIAALETASQPPLPDILRLTR